MSPSCPHILVINPKPITREGIVAVLSASLTDSDVTGCADFPEALAFVEGYPVDLIITDFRSQGDTVLSLLKALNGRNPKPRCLILSASDEIQVGYPCIRAGASGFVEKSSPVAIVVEAARSILAGRPYVSERLSQALMANGGNGRAASAGTHLTARELHIFSLIGEGMAVSMIAVKLGLSVKTVEAHREHIKTKLGHQCASQLAAAAVRWLDDSSVII
jgi:DNA-binding NarL/FixJ family response regulator